MIVGLFALLQAAAIQPSPPMAEPSQPVIWRDLRAGMSPERFAESLRKVDGIKAVDVTRKGKKAAKVKIAYIDGKGIIIGDLNASIVPSFADDHLETVTLSDSGCFSTETAKTEKLIAALAEKHPHQQHVRVVNSDGVSIDAQQAFYNDEARVTLSLNLIENPYPQHLYGGTGFLAAANKLANSMADSAYNSATAACPLDRGRKANIELEYMSQAQFLVQHSKEEVDRLAKAKATKDGL